jgi:hypothetical protein
MAKLEIMKWTEKDTAEVAEKGMSLQEVEDQLKKIARGPAELQIERACTSGDGIHIFDELEAERQVSRYDDRDESTTIAKFVPASGAASRMFRHLHQFLIGENTELASLFFENLSSFPFFEEIKTHFSYNFDEPLSNGQKKSVAEFLMSAEGMRFANIPKGLVTFHKEGDKVKTAFEEQLREGVHYLDGSQTLHFHFTVSPLFRSEIEKHLKAIAEKSEFQKYSFDFLLSEQEPATDTIAANTAGEPFRESSGELLFRPGGHGALLTNLEKNDADILFIKNIDNVVHSDHLELTVKWKKVLGGCLLELREKTFKLIEDLQSSVDGAEAEAEEFLRKKLGLGFELSASQVDQRKQLIHLLDRPMRVCGMVKNQGEPGGGPFWVKDEHGISRPQIVEKAQLNDTNKIHMAALESASHFNPVDLVCSLKRHDGTDFDLSEFVDHSAFFISEKSKDGRALKALELPGLWNGAMAYWNSFFVEVPLETFNPVKTVNDLLKPMHQPAR